MKLISIIMPAYNAEKYIENTIMSVVKQTYKNWELVIVNDGSTDNTHVICEKMQKEDSRIKYYYKVNEGVSIARNYALEKANGDLIMFVDSDDSLDSDMIEKLYNNMEKTGADVVRCSYYINSDIKVIEDYEAGVYDQNEIRTIIIDKILKEKIKCYLWLLLVNKDVIDRFNKNLHIYEDFCFYLNALLKSSRMSLIKENLYHYNKENNNSLSKKNIVSNINNMISAKKYILDILENNNLNTEENRRKISSRIYTNIINYIFLYQCNNKFKDAIGLYRDLYKNKEFVQIKKDYCSNYLSKKERVLNFSIKNHIYILFWFLCLIKKNKYKKNN